MTQGAAPISGNQLVLHGRGQFTLTNAGNDFQKLAAATTGTISYSDTNGLTINNVALAPNGVVSGGNPITLTTGGALTIGTAGGNEKVDAGAARRRARTRAE